MFDVCNLFQLAIALSDTSSIMDASYYKRKLEDRCESSHSMLSSPLKEFVSFVKLATWLPGKCQWTGP